MTDWTKEIQNKLGEFKCASIEIHGKITTFINSISELGLGVEQEDYLLITANNNSTIIPLGDIIAVDYLFTRENGFQITFDNGDLIKFY